MAVIKRAKVKDKKPGMLHKVGEKLGLIEKVGELDSLSANQDSSSVEQCVKSGGTWKGGKCQMKGKGKGKTLLEKQVKEAGVFEGNRVPGQKYAKPT